MKKLTFLFGFIFLFAAFMPVVQAQSSACVNGKTASGLTCVPITTPSGTGDGTSNGTTPAPATTNTTNTITPCGSNCNLGYTPLEPIPGLTTDTGGKYDLTSSTGFANLISAVFKILISAGALLAVLSLTLGGVQYMTANSLGNKKNGLDRAKASIYGILLIAAIYIILNTLNPNLLKFNFNPCPVNNATCASINYNVTNTTSNTTAATPAGGTVNGGGTALGDVATVGTITGDQMRAANASLGLSGINGVAMDKVLVYDPTNLSSTNSAAINAFTAECQNDFASNVTFGYHTTHSVAIVQGSTVGASGQSAMVCIAN